MKVELTYNSVDIVTTKAGLKESALVLLAAGALFLMGGWKVGLVLIAFVALVTIPYGWMRSHRPAGKIRPSTPAVGGPRLHSS